MGAMRCANVDGPGVRGMDEVNNVDGLTAGISKIFVFSDGSLMSPGSRSSIRNIEEIVSASLDMLLTIFLTSS